MTGEWREAALGEIAELFDGPHATPAKTKTGPVFLGISNLAQGRLDLSSCEHLSEEDYQRWTRRVTPQADDLVFSYETRLGEAALIPSGLRCCLGRRMGLLRARPGKVDARFLLYAYLGPEFQQTLRSRTIPGSTVDRIPLIEMAKFPIRVPTEIDEQRAIAHILGTLDTKIDLNRRMNETLEAIGLVLFESWFVDFDPVRSKADGRNPGLREALSHCFPASFVGTELGEVPTGWRLGTIGEEFEITMGQSPPGNTYNEVGEGLPFFQGRSDFTFRFPVRRVFCTAPTRLAKEGDTLVSVRAPVGDINMAAEPCSVGRGVAAVRHKSGSRSYTYYLMKVQNAMFDHFEAEGTVFGAINKSDFAALPNIVPSKDAVLAFERVVSSIDDRISLNSAQIGTVTALRDTLLPRLIAGELRLPDVARVIGRCD